MPYMDIRQFIETQFYPESRPSLTTVKRWIREGEIKARKIGGKFYIDPEVDYPSDNNEHKSDYNKQAGKPPPEEERKLTRQYLSKFKEQYDAKKAKQEKQRSTTESLHHA